MIDRLDHLVLTVASINDTCAFYNRVLGMQVARFGKGRVALTFGRQKINLHQAGREIDPKAKVPTPGSADLCLITNISIEDLIKHLERCAVAVEIGPVPRTGATGSITSVYFRDPDSNLIEVSRYD